MKFAGRLFVALLLVVVAVASYRTFWGNKGEITYETAAAERKRVEGFVAATGAIESTTTVTVGSQVSGPISEILVDFNSVVERGQPLARIDPSEFLARQQQQQASLQSAKAGLASAQASLLNQNALVEQAEVAIKTASLNLDQLVASVTAAEAALDNSRATLSSRQIELENNLVQYQRAEDLVQRELVALSERDMARTSYLVSGAAVETATAAVSQTQAQLLQARSQVQGAENDIKAAQARLASARAQRQAAQAQVTSAEATVAQAQAQLSQVSVDLERTTIVSPISGVVIDRKVDEGQTVAAQFQAPELFTIARSLDQMQVKAEVSEADIGRVKEKAPVTFTVDAYPGQKFEGVVTQVRSAPDKQEGSSSNVVVYGVMVSAPNPENLLKPGMTATVEILAENIDDALVIPSQALRFVPRLGLDKEETKEQTRGRRGQRGNSDSKVGRDSSKDETEEQEELAPGTRKAVAWVLRDGKPVRRDLIVGLSLGDETVVLSGDLEVGEEVILSEDDGKGDSRQGFRLRI